MVRLTRRTLLSLLAIGVPITAALVQAHSATDGLLPRSGDALQRVVLQELGEFTSWLSAQRVKGFIGEVGWPDNTDGEARAWNALADAWFNAADRAGLWVSAWASGEWWEPGYKLAIYRKQGSNARVDTANTQASILEEHASTRSYLRGIAVAGGAFASPTAESSSTFSNASPGAYDVDYHYDTVDTFQYLAQRGMHLARIDFRWERIQPRLGQALDEAELQRLETAVNSAGAAGMQVVLDLHNYAAYYLSDGTRGVRRAIGTPELPAAHLADLWQRLSARFGDDPRVVAYGLMNEPTDIPAAFQARVRYPPLDPSPTGWRADNDGPEILTRESTLTQGSAFGLKVSRTYPSTPGYGHLRVLDNGGGSGAPRDLSGGGDTLAVWVYVPGDVPGTQWQARPFVYGARQSSDALDTTGLQRGAWTRVTGRFTTDALRDVRAIGVQVYCNDVSGQAWVVLDAFAQGTQRNPAQVWEDVSQSVVEAIRATGDHKLIAVSGYGWSRVQDWSSRHPKAWINDPEDQIRYEAHHYWDRTQGSFYIRTYADEVADVQRPS